MRKGSSGFWEIRRLGRRKLQKIAYTRSGQDTYIYIYMHIYACCRRGIWSPRGGNPGHQTLPAAERIILRGGILANMDVTQKGRFRDQIPLLRGPDSPYTFLGRKRHFDHRPNCSQTSIFIVVSCKIGPILEKKKKPKIAEKASSRDCGYQRSVLRGGGGFFYHFPFFFCLILFVGSFWPLQTMEALETPYFVVFSLVSCFRNFRLPEPPPYDIFIDLLPFSNFGLKNAQKNSKHGGQIVWPEFPPRFLPAFT